MSESKSSRTVEEIRAEIANLKGELASLSGTGLEIWNGRDGGVNECPDGGAVLSEVWALDEHSKDIWYPTAEAAKAALALLAEEHHSAVDGSGFNLDLTAYDSHDSRAYVTRH